LHDQLLRQAPRDVGRDAGVVAADQLHLAPGDRAVVLEKIGVERGVHHDAVVGRRAGVGVDDADLERRQVRCGRGPAGEQTKSHHKDGQPAFEHAHLARIVLPGANVK
jgi:hypothetical protein